MRFPNTALPRLALPLALSLLASPPVFADAERLGNDLRALVAEHGELTIGDLSTSLLGGETRAEDLRFESLEGETLLIERYVVEGDYEHPDTVTLEGIRVEGVDLEDAPPGLEDDLLLNIGSIVVEAPGSAVPPLDDETLAEQWFEVMSLAELSLDHPEGALASLIGLELDGDFEDGEGGLSLEALEVDLSRLIALSPEEERTQMRMVSNVLTEGSGLLRLDGGFDAQWEPSGEQEGRLVSSGELALRDALSLALDLESLLALPEGVDVAELMADGSLLEEASLGGGHLVLSLAEQGLFGRLMTLGATMEGVSEAEYLEKARTQAEGFGMMFGPQVSDLLHGLVDLMAGSAEELVVTLDLPAEERLESFAEDPLALPERFAMQVETR
ncbi:MULTISPECIES: hypothetical protein [unclassified Halomonas]|uniref:hypothetical protein n=1 Tax=unclassified Halomonas TaxID=2609666 RepID=UPI002884E6C3|nr:MULTISPECIES: hypothetical protein [unclassified Halomonas]MDT0500728.1 hypothetical protein [Halomonas sp. PAR7]MDT0513082.1 hypothetical protein [Halomonas sp. LES1]MDT0591507.1 hypothetical protein [Halomonas sp. PAR8]